MHHILAILGVGRRFHFDPSDGSLIQIFLVTNEPKHLFNIVHLSFFVKCLFKYFDTFFCSDSLSLTYSCFVFEPFIGCVVWIVSQSGLLFTRLPMPFDG